MRFTDSASTSSSATGLPLIDAEHDPIRVVPDLSRRRRAFARLARLGVGSWLAMVDALAVVAASIAADSTAPWTVVLLALTLALNRGLHLYRSRLSLSLLDDIPRLVAALLIAGALTAATAAIATDDLLGRDWWLHVVAATGFVVLGRAGAYSTIRGARRRRLVAHRTLIVGTDPVARHLAALMSSRASAGLVPVAFFDPSGSTPLAGRRLSGLPVHSGIALDDASYTTDANVIVIAFGDEPDYDAVQRVRDASQLHAEIFFVPRFFELQGIASTDMDHLFDVPLFRLRRWSHRSRSWRVKRAFDVGFAATVLLVAAPLLGFVALAIRLTMGAPLLFRQQRIGLAGEPFTILKFRSLPIAPATETDRDWNAQQTRQPNAVGRFLRASSIDELPQLWNVLRGDMSLVGPRPERPGFVAEFNEMYPDYRQRHRVPVGITGLAQVEGLRGDTPIADRARFDNLYVENWSLWGDVKILLRTIGAVFRREGD